MRAGAMYQLLIWCKCRFFKRFSMERVQKFKSKTQITFLVCDKRPVIDKMN